MQPDQLEQCDFSIVRRGFDPEEVRVVLLAAAKALRSARDGDAAVEIERLQRTVDELERGRSLGDLDVDAAVQGLQSDLDASRRAEAAATAALAELQRQVEVLERDRTELTDQLDQSTELIGQLRTELEAASATQGDAQDQWKRLGIDVSGILRAAEQESARLRADARGEEKAILDRAAEEAGEIRAQADAYADQVTQQADAWAATRLRQADAALAQSRDEIEDAKSQARDLIRQVNIQIEAQRHNATAALRQLIEGSAMKFRTRAQAVEDHWTALDTLLTDLRSLVDRAQRTTDAPVDLELDIGDILTALNAADERVTTSAALVSLDAARVEESGAQPATGATLVPVAAPD